MDLWLAELIFSFKFSERVILANLEGQNLKSQKFSYRVGPNHGGPSYDTVVWPLHF